MLFHHNTHPYQGNFPKYSVNPLFIQVTCLKTTCLYNPNDQFNSNALVFIHILNKRRVQKYGRD